MFVLYKRHATNLDRPIPLLDSANARGVTVNPRGRGDSSSMPTERTVRLTSVAEGQVIGGNKYRLIRCVGEGGMGFVFSAKHIEFDEMVAIKFMKRDLVGSEE